MPRRNARALVRERWAILTLAWRLAGVLLLLVVSPAHAATQAQIDAARNKGLAWLLTHQLPDGSWRSTAGLEFATTAASVGALTSAGLRGYPLTFGVAWLSNAEARSVDSLARKILALKPTGVNVTPFLQRLVAWRNGALTWGAYASFDTSFPDTPLALAALRTSQYTYADPDYQAALCAILTAQKTDGSWSYIKPGTSPPPSAIGSAVLPTSRNLLEINALSTWKNWPSVTCSAVPYTIATVLNNGITWLLNQRRNATTGGFGEPLNGQVVSTVFDTSLAYEVLALLRPTDAATGAALDYLIAQQRNDGSWNGDMFQTASVLRLLPGLAGALLDTDKDSIPDVVEPLLKTDPGIPDSRWLANPYDGDLNQDGVVDAADVSLAEQILSAQIPLTPLFLYHGDVYPAGQPDGLLDSRDLDRIRDKALGQDGF